MNRESKILLGLIISIASLCIIHFSFKRVRNDIQQDKISNIKMGMRSNRQDYTLAFLDCFELLLVSLSWILLVIFLLHIPLARFKNNKISKSSLSIQDKGQG